MSSHRQIVPFNMIGTVDKCIMNFLPFSIGGCSMFFAILIIRFNNVVTDIFNTRAVLRIPKPSLVKSIICLLVSD
jgi:hypothetical protein